MKVLFIAIMTLASVALAEPLSTEPLGSGEAITRTGRYVTVTLFPGNPIKIFVAGKERLRLNLSDLKLEVSSLPNQQERLEVNRDGNYFVVKNSESLPEMKMLEVRTTLKRKKSETFKFRLNKP